MRRLIVSALLSAAIALTAAAPASAGTTANPTNLDFGSVPIGTQSQTLPVTLTQSCDLLLIDCILTGELFSPVISATSGFTQGNNCPTSLLANLLPVSCTIDVSFVPVVGGTLNGLLNTGTGGPAVNLTGNGVAGTSSTPTTTKKRKKCKKKKKGRAAASAKKKCKKKKRKR